MRAPEKKRDGRMGVVSSNSENKIKEITLPQAFVLTSQQKSVLD